MKAVTKRKARSGERRRARSGPQRGSSILAHSGHLYKAAGGDAEMGPDSRTDTVPPPHEGLRLELVQRLRATLGIRPLVEQVARIIVETYASDFVVTDRVLKLRYIMGLFNLSPDALPEAIRALVNSVRLGVLDGRTS